MIDAPNASNGALQVEQLRTHRNRPGMAEISQSHTNDEAEVHNFSSLSIYWYLQLDVWCIVEGAVSQTLTTEETVVHGKSVPSHCTSDFETHSVRTQHNSTVLNSKPRQLTPALQTAACVGVSTF